MYLFEYTCIKGPSYLQRKGLHRLVTFFQMGDFYYVYMDMSHLASKFFATHVLYLLYFLVNIGGKNPCDYFTEVFNNSIHAQHSHNLQEYFEIYSKLILSDFILLCIKNIFYKYE